jgi:sporulation protein YlmC with PRC-barrel domain
MFFRLNKNPPEEISMSKLALAGSILAATLLSSAAFAQTSTTAPPPAATKADAGPKLTSPHWRASKLIGVKIYNEQNERLGDVNEIITDASGKVMGYVIGVGGFLGMGEHDIFVEPGKIKFVNEPVRTTAAPANTPSTKTDPAMTTRPASNTAARAASEVWYPDHGVLSATKDQLKAMPQFKYSNYN